ncbi:MAG: tyrosine-type recombinase/integrase [Gemmataceae bacterium]
MARKKKQGRNPKGLPWYSESRDVWVVPGCPKKTALRDDGGLVRGGTEASRVRAMAAWHALQAADEAGRAGADNPVKVILDLYLQDCHRRAVSPKTMASYVSYFQSFADRWPGLLVKDLKPYHVHQWWAKDHPGWGASTQNLSGSALKAAFRWAAEPGKGGAIIPTNPLGGMSLPTMRKRSAEVVVTDEEFAGLLALVDSPAVRDILVVAWESGTRPVNLSRATAANVTADGKALLFADWNTEEGSAVHKTFKRTGRPLVVPLPGPAADVVARLVAKYPTGPLFRTPTGLEWTATNLATLVAHYAKRAGLDGRFTPYSCRHSRATHLLESGASLTDTAAILGNTPGVVDRNYSHVRANTDRLLGIMGAARVTSGTASPPAPPTADGPA